MRTFNCPQLLNRSVYLQAKLRLSRGQKEELAEQGQEIADVELMQSEGCSSIARSLRVIAAATVQRGTT